MESGEMLKMYCDYHKIRFSKIRKTVLDYLSVADTSLDAESLWIKLRFEGHTISRTSVYLALHWLADQGFANTESKNNKSFYTVGKMNYLEQLVQEKTVNINH